MKRILLTGAAGFIGFKTAEFLLKSGFQITGIDNLNDYYDIRLKEWRLTQLKKFPGFKFSCMDIEDTASLGRLFRSSHGFETVINLAARAGVRYSLENPMIYMSTNALGTLNLLETMRQHNVKKMVLASSSSLYAGQKMPFIESLPVNTPISPYAASKKAAELIAYTYHHLYRMDVVVLRFFTVYGPAGRPDMSPYRFVKWIAEGKEVMLYGDGTQRRDFTFIDDIALGTIQALKVPGFEIINLGSSHPYSLNELIGIVARALGKKAKVIRMPSAPADLKATWADIHKARRILRWRPKISLREGIKRTVDWHIRHRGLVKKIVIDIEK